MAMYGMDIENVRATAKALHDQAEAIGQISSTLEGQVTGTTWEGPDAKRFKSDWQQYKTMLSQVKVKLEEYSQLANRNADEQDQISR